MLALSPQVGGSLLAELQLLILICSADDDMEVDEEFPGEFPHHFLLHKLKFSSSRRREGKQGESAAARVAYKSNLVLWSLRRRWHCVGVLQGDQRGKMWAEPLHCFSPRGDRLRLKGQHPARHDRRQVSLPALHCAREKANAGEWVAQPIALVTNAQKVLGGWLGPQPCNVVAAG